MVKDKSEFDNKIDTDIQCTCCFKKKENPKFLMCKECRKNMFYFTLDTLKEFNINPDKMFKDLDLE